MKLNKWARLAGLSCVVLLVGAVSARAVMIAPAPLSQRVAVSDCIVIGKVTSVEEKTVAAPRFPNDKEKGEYKVAIIKIEEGFGSAKRLTHIKVGFVPSPMVQPQPQPLPGPGPRPTVRPIRRVQNVQLVEGQEVCLFLKPHFDANFFIAQNYYDAITKQKDNAEPFNKEVAEVKRLSKLLENATTNLESKNADDRFLTAAMLLIRYRTPKMPNPATPKTEPIDAAESKQILLALANADWAPPQTPVPFGRQTSPQQVFSRLGLTDKDGWMQPKDYKQFPEAAAKWLKDHADTYRIQRFVTEEKKTEK